MATQYNHNYDHIAWTKRERPRFEKRPQPDRRLQIIHDIKEFQSPIDRSWITSRKELRDHERKHNVRQIGNDWAGSTKPSNWEKISGQHK